MTVLHDSYVVFLTPILVICIILLIHRELCFPF